jgi:hypothetical protein
LLSGIGAGEGGVGHGEVGWVWVCYCSFEITSVRGGLFERIANEWVSANECTQKRGREFTPSYVIIDSQSVKANFDGRVRGFFRGK